MNQKLQTISAERQQQYKLEDDLAAELQKLRQLEKELAEEQAAVNAFRMHCRLTIGHWVDTLLNLRSQKQTLLIQEQLLLQALGRPRNKTEEREENPQATSEEVDQIAQAILEDLIDAEKQRESEKQLYRDLARRFHPDLGANDVEKAYRTSIMAAVNVAYQQRDVQTLRDLAGEIDPEVIAEIKAIDSKILRQLRHKIVRCQRYQRKVKQQLFALRQENTARLWRMAIELEVTGNSDWWQEIKHTLAQDVDALEAEVELLKHQVERLEEEQEALE